MIFRKLLTASLMLGMLAACTPRVTDAPEAAPSATRPVEATATDAPPSATPTLTPSPAPTETATPTLPPSPTPLAQFEEFEVLSIENLQVGGARITIKLPGIGVPLSLVLEGRTYNCKPDPTVPDRLFCSGLAMPPLNQSIPAALSQPDTSQIVWSGETVLRNNLVVFPVRRVYFARPECSEPGKNLGCETECRINTNGSPCVVSTCFDVCGPYFSVHTCDPNMNKPFTMCAPDVTEQMKILYGVP